MGDKQIEAGVFRADSESRAGSCRRQLPKIERKMEIERVSASAGYLHIASALPLEAALP